MKHEYHCDEPGCMRSVKADVETADYLGWSIELGGVYCPDHAKES